MSAAQQLRRGAIYAVSLPQADDFAFWRDRARQLLQCDVPPDCVTWVEPEGTGSLFAHDRVRLPVPDVDARTVRASKAFLQAAKTAICHSDPERFALLYRLLWRLQSAPRMLEDRADPDVRRLDDLTRAVRRDIHKMRAFVRFRCVEDGEGSEHYVAWFEPEHHILRTNAGFFTRRFTNMHWSILTPKGSIHWDGKVLREGPPARKSDAPQGDAAEDLWRKYYASIFNPARLKVGAMLSEMPRKYWKNMPEAELIPGLVAGAQAREAQMVERGAEQFAQPPATLKDIASGIAGCRNCPIGGLENRAVPGEGPHDAAQGFSGLMIVGEQPGDQEDTDGRPFVGPAGQLLDMHLQRAGIDRGKAYVTNAVKHFKYTMRGKRRLHQSPAAKEVDTCRWWLEGERALVRPKLVLALGASAARGMLGRTVSIADARGVPVALEDGSELRITVHPSYLLRLDGAAREEQERLFAADLAAARARLAELAAG